MQERQWLFKASSIVVKIGAWLILVVGFFSGGVILLGFVKDSTRWVGVGVFLSYLLLSAFLLLVSEIAKILMKILDTIKKE